MLPLLFGEDPDPFPQGAALGLFVSVGQGAAGPEAARCNKDTRALGTAQTPPNQFRSYQTG